MCCKIKKDFYELYTKILFHRSNTNKSLIATLDTLLTRTTYFDQLRKKATQ